MPKEKLLAVNETKFLALSAQFHLTVSLSTATLTKNKKWNPRLKFCETDSTKSLLLSCRDNNCTSFHLNWKKNSVKHLKVSKYFENDRLQNIILLFMSLLIAPIIKNSHFYTRIYFVFLKKVQKQTWKPFNTKFWPQ